MINYVFESSESLHELLDLLHPLDPSIHCYWLTCDEEEQAKRIRNRGREDLEWELGRFVELRRIQKEASQHGFIGKEVDTTRMSAQEAAQTIWNDSFLSQAAKQGVQRTSGYAPPKQRGSRELLFPFHGLDSPHSPLTPAVRQLPQLT